MQQEESALHGLLKIPPVIALWKHLPSFPTDMYNEDVRHSKIIYTVSGRMSTFYYCYFYTHTYISTKIKNNDITVSISGAAKLHHQLYPLYIHMCVCIYFFFFSVYIHTHTARDGLCSDDGKQAVRPWESCVWKRINIIISALQSL